MKTHLLSKPRSSPVYFLLLGSADLYLTLSLIRRPVSLQTKCCSTSLVDLSTGSLCKRADTGNCGWNDLLASFVKVDLTPSTAVSGLRFLEINFFCLHHSVMVYCAQLPKCKLYLTNFCSCMTRLFFWRYFVQVSSKEAGEGSCHRLYRPRCGKLPTKWIKIFEFVILMEYCEFSASAHLSSHSKPHSRTGKKTPTHPNVLLQPH